MTNAILALTSFFILVGSIGLFIGVSLVDNIRTNRAEPFGVCTKDHPNYNEKLCPKDELRRWKILQEDRVLNNKRWSDLDCDCPQKKEDETPLEKWDRESCYKVCSPDTQSDGEKDAPASADDTNICNPHSSVYNLEGCEKDPIAKWRWEQEQIILQKDNP